MPPSFAGPHHCLGTARRVSDEVFAEIRDAAARQGGTLTLQQIEALKAAYDEAAPQRFRAIECIFNTCMCAAAKESMPKAFDEVELVSRFLYAHTSGIAWAVFESRFERPDRAWLAEFYRVLARFVVGRFDPDFPPRAIAVYIEAGQQKGQALSVCDLVQSEQGRAAVHECLLRIMAEPVTPQLAARALRGDHGCRGARRRTEADHDGRGGRALPHPAAPCQAGPRPDDAGRLWRG